MLCFTPQSTSTTVLSPVAVGLDLSGADFGDEVFFVWVVEFRRRRILRR